MFRNHILTHNFPLKLSLTNGGCLNFYLKLRVILLFASPFKIVGESNVIYCKQNRSYFCRNRQRGIMQTLQPRSAPLPHLLRGYYSEVVQYLYVDMYSLC